MGYWIETDQALILAWAQLIDKAQPDPGSDASTAPATLGKSSNGTPPPTPSPDARTTAPTFPQAA